MSKYLSKAMLSALVVMGTGAMLPTTSGADPTLPPVHAYYPYQPGCNPVDNSCMDNGGWSGSQYDGDPNSGGDGGDNGEAWEARKLETCSELIEKGLPEGCNRTLAEAGTPMPNLNIPSSLELLFTYAPGRAVAAQRERAAQQALSVCYANVSLPPAECEARYLQQVSQLWQGMTLPANYRDYLADAVANLQTRFVNTESDRYWAGFFGQYSAGFSWYNLGFDTSVATVLFSFGQYNQALVQARQQKNCSLWFIQWDTYDCDNI